MANYEDKIIDAIEEIVDNAVANAGYDKTIQCTIIECIDATIGKYKVKYQDSSFIAYSGGSDITYAKGSEVYVLIPSNDMSRDKTILGTTLKLGPNYVGEVENENKFERVGNNCIDSSNEYELCSYKDGIKILYDKDANNNEIQLNLRSIETYIRNSSSIICGGDFKTNLPIEQQFRGNYGIVFELEFYNNAYNGSSDEVVTRNYIVDVNQMLGNPYKQNKWTRQYGIFDLDVVNFRQVNRIYLFVKDFPHKADNKPADIFIKDLEFCGAVRTDDLELETYGLVFITPQGTYFDDNDADTAKRSLQAQVRVKGQNIDNNSQSVDYYWFVENVGVTTMHEDYCVYGGQGWQCKNLKNQVGTDASGKPIYEWVPAGYEYTTTKAENQARETKYKCIAVYNDVLLSKEIVITNYSSEWDITIESDQGTQFYFDNGNPTLTCKVNGQIKDSDEFTYLWAEVDSSNNFRSLAETTDENNEYNAATAGYAQLLADIEAELAMPAASQQQLNDYLTTIEKYDKIMRVEKMYIHNLSIKQIINFATYKCSVYYNGIFIGSTSIIITNSLNAEGVYTLVINNGAQVFKYDEAGISPVSTTLNKPITLKPLAFTLYDNLGQAIDEDILKTCNIRWIVPTKDTLIEIPEAYGTPEFVDLINGTATYTNHLTAFTYLLAYKYDISKNNNNIQLEIDYKDNTFVAKTNLVFTKEGEDGTNGTEFICRIVPNTAANEKAPLYPMILNGEPNYARPSEEENRWFRLQMWHNGEKIFEGSGENLNITSEDQPLLLTWSVLANRYNLIESDNSDITVEDLVLGKFKYNGYVNNSSPANVVKCAVTYKGVQYYATMPIITAITEYGYKVRLKDNAGFRYAMYSADGRRPQYDDANPFELIVERSINGYIEDVSRMTQAEAIDYEWNIQGKVYDPVNKIWNYEDNIHLIKVDKKVERNQIVYRPIDDYIGECLNIGLECVMTRSGNPVGRIHIPIHFYLNRYGHAAINDWDGNSVSIDENGNGVILAPQVGAGIKENDNSFTGMLMGKVKESGQNNYDVGLTGYYKGQRTLHLSAYDGYAIFGKVGPGQIILDPTSDQAMIYSYNFWADYYDDTTNSKKNGLPITDYSYDKTINKYKGQKNQSTEDMQKTNEGMLIDLTTPRILFGSGNFRVEPNGYLYARGGGQIAGWKINDYRFDSVDNGEEPTAVGNTGISSVYEEHAAGVTEWNVYHPKYENGKVNKPIAFWAGGTNTDGKFHIAHDGYVRMTEATIGSGNTDNLIYIGNEGNSSAIYSFNKQEFNKDANGFYIGTNGFALGKTTIYDKSTIPNLSDELCGTFSKWAVTPEGRMYAQDAIIKGTLYSSEGMIGGWNITENTLTSKGIEISSDGSIKHTGNKWYIKGDGTASFGNGLLQIDNDEVTIGGWIVGKNDLHNGNLYLDSTGNLRGGTSGGNSWRINSDGTATFTYITANRGGMIGGWTISQGYLSNGGMVIDGENAILKWKDQRAGKGGFFICGDGTDHPRVSALNVNANSGYGGVAFYTGLDVSGVTDDSGYQGALVYEKNYIGIRNNFGATGLFLGGYDGDKSPYVGFRIDLEPPTEVTGHKTRDISIRNDHGNVNIRPASTAKLRIYGSYNNSLDYHEGYSGKIEVAEVDDTLGQKFKRKRLCFVNGICITEEDV